MAQLTDQLNSIDRGKPIIATDAGGSDGLGIVLGNLARGIDGFADMTARRASQKAAEARLAEQMNEKSAFSNAVSAAIDLNNAVNDLPDAQASWRTLNPQTVSDVVHPPRDFADAIADATKAAKTINKYQTAADQGTMPTISVAANVDRIYQELLAKHGPTAGQAIVQGLDAAGVKGYLVQNLKDRLTTHDDQLKAANAADSDAFKTGMQVTGGGVGLSREQITAYGYEKQKNDMTLAASLQSLNIQQAQQSLTTSQRTQIKQDTSDAFLQHFMVDGANFMAGLAPQVQKLSTLAVEGGPDAQSQFLQLGTQIDTVIQNRINQTVAQAVATGGLNASQAEQLRASLVSQASGITDLYKGEASIVSTNQKAFQNFQAVTGLNAAQSLPVFARLRSAGINPTMIPDVIQGVMSDPGLKQSLQREIKGLSSTDPQGPVGQIALNNIVQLLKGNRTIQDHPMDEAVKLMPSLYNVAHSQAVAINNNSGDTTAFSNAMANIITATRSINGNTNIGANYTAAAAVATAPARAAMIKMLADPRTAEEGQALITGSRASSAIVLGNMRRVLNGSYGYYSAQFNKASGRFEAVLDQKAWQGANKPGSAANMLRQPDQGTLLGGTVRTGPNRAPDVPLALSHALDAANRSLDHLVSTTQYDKNVPKMTPIELRRFYGADQVPASMKGKGKGNTTEVNPLLEYQKAENALKGELDKGPSILSPVTIQNTPFDIVKNPILQKESGGDYNAVVYGEKAPKNPTEMTIGEAYKFQKSDLRPKTKGRRGPGDIGSTGIGAYQFESETLRQTAEHLFGANWRDIPFSKDNQDALAEALWGHVRNNEGLARNTWAAVNDILG